MHDEHIGGLDVAAGTANRQVPAWSQAAPGNETPHCSSTCEPLTFEPDIQTICTATAKTRRKGYKVMSRRCQMGTEVKEGGWYRVRVRDDVPGAGRIHKSIPICPVSGPDSLSKVERKRKQMNIVAQFNSERYVKMVAAQEDGTTVKAQSLIWTERCGKRKRKPMKPSTLRNWQSILDNHVLPVLGSTSLQYVGNKAMKDLVEVLVGKGYRHNPSRTSRKW